MAPAVHHELTDTKLHITIDGVSSLEDIQDLDVSSDVVNFVVRNFPLTVRLGRKAIDTASCKARFKQERLTLSWKKCESEEGPNRETSRGQIAQKPEKQEILTCTTSDPEKTENNNNNNNNNIDNNNNNNNPQPSSDSRLHNDSENVENSSTAGETQVGHSPKVVSSIGRTTDCNGSNENTYKSSSRATDSSAPKQCNSTNGHLTPPPEAATTATTATATTTTTSTTTTATAAAAAAAATAATEAIAGTATSPSTIFCPYKVAVGWAIRKLGELKIPETATGFDRFKAEVGLAELLFYGLRAARLGVQQALHPQLCSAEDRLRNYLRGRASGEQPPGEAPFECGQKVLKRVANAVRNDYMALDGSSTTWMLGHPQEDASCLPSNSQNSTSKTGASHRWKLRDGSLIGPGVGTWKLSVLEAEKRIRAALRLGVRHFDCAAEYGTEGAVATAIADSTIPRAELFINVKVAAESAEDMRKALVDMRTRWGEGHIDCLMMHKPPSDPTKFEEVWSVLEEEVRQGRARLLGASNITEQQLETLCKATRDQRFWPALVQIKCSVFHQGGYFSETSLSNLWSLIRQKGVVPVGISLFNSLHSTVEPLEEPMLKSWSSKLSISPAKMMFDWSRQIGVCPLVRCSESHASELFGPTFELPTAVMGALTGLAALTEHPLCQAPFDTFRLRASDCGSKGLRRYRACGEALRGRVVQIHSLRSTAGRDLNGQTGLLMDFDEASGRWGVALPVGDRKIRSENLALLPLDSKSESNGDDATRAGRFLQELFQTGGMDKMLEHLTKHREAVTWALAETVEANLENSQAKGFAVKAQVLAKLLVAVQDELKARQPRPEQVPLPPPMLSGKACWYSNGAVADSRRYDEDEAERLASACAALLEEDGYLICEEFVAADEIASLAAELSSYGEGFETAKIWVGKDAAGAQLSVPAVRSDRIMWVCGQHHTPVEDHLWDSAGTQPKVGLAPCKPNIVSSSPITSFPQLTKLMRRVDDFVLHRLAPKVPRLVKLVERSDCMVSRYEEGARFQRHIDNPNQDGRRLTTVLYLNSTGEPWREEDGGALRIFPKDSSEAPMDYLPQGGRLALFYADIVPHEVRPSERKRMALTYWWFDRGEREHMLADIESTGVNSINDKDEQKAQEFIAFMLNAKTKCEELLPRAEKLSKRALATVAAVVGAETGDQALEGLGRLKSEDLDRLRGSMGRMGLD